MSLVTTWLYHTQVSLISNNNNNITVSALLLITQILIRFIIQEKEKEGKTPSSLWYFEEMKFAWCIPPLSAGQPVDTDKYPDCEFYTRKIKVLTPDLFTEGDEKFYFSCDNHLIYVFTLCFKEVNKELWTTSYADRIQDLYRHMSNQIAYLLGQHRQKQLLV